MKPTSDTRPDIHCSWMPSHRTAKEAVKLAIPEGWTRGNGEADERELPKVAAGNDNGCVVDDGRAVEMVMPGENEVDAGDLPGQCLVVGPAHVRKGNDDAAVVFGPQQARRGRAGLGMH